MSDGVYAVYTLNERKNTRDFVYDTLDRVKTVGEHIDWDNYKHVYTGALGPHKAPDLDTLHGIWDKLGNAPPEDFKGRLSVGDIIVLHDKGAKAYIATEDGYADVSAFLNAPYRYYSTQRPVDIGTFPKTDNGPARIVNFEKRESVENATFRAWGYLAYDAPLTAPQISNYELRAASDNPDNVRVSPYQFEAQLEVIGKWEQTHRLSDRARITWFHNDFGVFVKKDWVMDEYVTDRFHDIAAVNARAAERPAAPRSMENKVQIIGHWEDGRGMPDSERLTWHKPSIQGFALREPVASPEQIEKRFQRAFRDLTREAERPAAPKRIADQLAEAQKQVERGAPAPARKHNKSHEDR